jgi:hypothetical protein
MNINLTLNDTEYKKLETISTSSGKSFDEIIKEMLMHDNPNASRMERLKKDPLYNIKPSDADVPSDYSLNIDKYLYNS